MKITILGAGAFGTALGSILEENKHELAFFDPYVFPKISLRTALKSSAAVILAAPSAEVPKLLKKLPKNLPLICASKGFLSTVPFQNFTDFSVLSGGAFASQLKAKAPTTLTATSAFAADLFTTKWLTIEQTTDTKGVLLCGALKNLYAIYSGYHAEEDHQTYEQFINAAVKELASILAENGGMASTAELSCGRQDLSITCSSTESRNYSFGASLRARKNARINRPIVAATTEGLAAYRAIKATADFKIPDSAPMLKEIIHLLDKNYDYS